MCVWDGVKPDAAFTKERKQALARRSVVSQQLPPGQFQPLEYETKQSHAERQKSSVRKA